VLSSIIVDVPCFMVIDVFASGLVFVLGCRGIVVIPSPPIAVSLRKYGWDQLRVLLESRVE
jgi:hypothetical protein